MPRKRGGWLKGLVLAVLGVAVTGGLVWQFWFKDQVAFAQVATGYAAQKVCSCINVSERDLASCLTDFTVDTAPFQFSVAPERAADAGSVAVTVMGGLGRATSSPTGVGGGCVAQ
jgi:hypothetical protein